MGIPFYLLCKEFDGLQPACNAKLSCYFYPSVVISCWRFAMFEKLEKAMLTGLGAMYLSQKKLEEYVNEVKEKYKVSEEEGKALLEGMQKMAKEGMQRMEDIAEVEVRKALDRIGMVPREDFELLQRRVAILENKIKTMVVEEDLGPEC